MQWINRWKKYVFVKLSTEEIGSRNNIEIKL